MSIERLEEEGGWIDKWEPNAGVAQTDQVLAEAIEDIRKADEWVLIVPHEVDGERCGKVLVASSVSFIEKALKAMAYTYSCARELLEEEDESAED